MNLRSARWIRRVALGGMISVLAVHAGWAQNYPQQPIKIIVPFAAGGGVDVVARIFTPKLSEELGQPIIIENRGGAGGMLGASALVQSQADGYTLLLGTGSTHGTNSNVYSRLTYDPVRDFTPIALVATSPLLLVTSPNLAATSLTEFIAAARSRRGEFSFGSYGTGSINHLAGELLNSMAGIHANHVPYRGSAPVLTDLMAGRIHYAFDGVATSLAHITEGRIRLLGVSSLKRSAVLPDRVTISESGLPGFETGVWFGLFAPAGTPKNVIDLLNRKVNVSLASPKVKDGFNRLGMEVVAGGSEVLASKVQAEIQKWQKLVQEKNIRIDP